MLHNIENKVYSKTLTTKNHVQITKLLELYKIEVTFLVIQHMTKLQQCKNPNLENIKQNPIKFA
jgi:sulfur relay (sulfurtransferase) DsrF/TusC family protein